MDLRHSTAALYQSKWTRFIGWCDRRGVDPFKATIPQIAEFFLFLRQELGLSVPAVKGYRAALNHVFLLTGLDLAASLVVSRMFRHFESSCPPREIRPPDWNLSLILRCLSRPPYEPLKMAPANILPGRHPFHLLLCQPKGLESYMAFPSGFVFSAGGSLVPSCSFLTSWLRARILQFLTLALRSSRCHCLMTSSEMTEISCCCVPSVPSGSIVQGLRACLSQWSRGSIGCPVTRFPSGYALSSPWPTLLLQRRIVVL